MKNIFRLVLLAVVIALGWWLWTVFFPSPEKVIRQRLTALTQTANFSDKDSVIVRASKARKLLNLFSADIQIAINTPEYGRHEMIGRDAMTEGVTAAFARSRALSVSFADVSVKVDPDRQSADVGLTAKVRVNGERDFGFQEMHFQFKKIDGDWLIARAETVKTLL